METTGFHYEDVPPQIWLDELHEFNIPRIWNIELDKTQRTNLSNRALDTLKQWRLNLRDQMKKIESRYDSSNRDKMKQMLAPYKLLDTLGADLNSQLRDLQSRLSSGRAIPQGFEIGERIFGDVATQRWHLGDFEDEALWDDFMATESRYKSIRREYKRQGMGLKNARQRVKEQQSELATLEADYKARSGFLQIGLRLFIVMIVVLLCLAIGIGAIVSGLPFESNASDTAIGAIFLVISVVGAMIAIVLMRRRRQSILLLEEEVVMMRTTLQSSKQEARRQKQLFFPTEDTFKQVQQDYAVLKKAFN
ncbi:MAG: hypothetical protein Phog2KO_07840 [Phototrophicaceae bacterium]